MSKPIEDQWTPLRHETLAAAEECTFTPGLGSTSRADYQRADGAQSRSVHAPMSRTLGWLAANRLTVESPPRPHALFATRPVKWTAEGRRVLKVWNARYGTPGGTLSPQAIAAIPEVVEYLEQVMRHYRGDVSSGIGVAAFKLTEQYRKATGTEDDE